MSQDAAVFGDLDVQQSSEQEEAEFGALELQQAQILFSALKAIQTDAAYMRWADEAAAEIEGIKERTAQAAIATQDAVARRAVLLMTKKDLADVCMEGLIAVTEQQQQSAVGLLLQGLLEFHDDTLDDWRDLLEYQEQRMQLEIESSRAALLRAEDTTRELLSALASEKAEKVLYALKSQMVQIELEQSGAYVVELEEKLIVLKNQVDLSHANLPEHVRVPSIDPKPVTNAAKSVSSSVPQLSVSLRSTGQGNQAQHVVSLHQLKDIIADVFSSKARANARALEQQQQVETMGEYLVAYLTTKYGIRQLIMQSLTCILAAIEHFTPMDAEIALYGKILRNEVEEQFEAEQRALQVSIEAALQSALQACHPLMPEARMSNMVQQHLKGNVDEAIWKPIVHGICKKDAAEVMRRLRVSVNEANSMAVVSSKSSPSNARTAEGKRRMQSKPQSTKDAIKQGTVSFQTVVQTVLRWNLEVHEHVLAPIVEAFRAKDHCRLGKLSEDQFSGFCRLINPAVTPSEISCLFRIAAHDYNSFVTFSNCAHVLMAEMKAMTHDR